MTTKKNIFLTSLLVLIILLSSALLFACGDKGNSANTYKLYSETLATYKQDDMFYSGALNSISSDYLLNNFYYKEDATGNKIYGYNNYLILGAYGLNFIEKYHENLNGLSISADYNSLDGKIESMNKSYNAMKIEYERLKNVDANVNIEIYNGYFARYRKSALGFVGSVYDNALALANFLTKNAKLDASVGSDDVTLTAYEFYLDRYYLYIFNDFENFFLNSCKGVVIDNDEYRNTESLFNLYCTNIIAKSKVVLSGDGLEDLQMILNKVEGDRKSGQTSLKEFSIYDYVTAYNSSLEAYNKADSNAQVYYNRLSGYFWHKNSVLVNLYGYLYDNVIASA